MGYSSGEVILQGMGSEDFCSPHPRGHLAMCGDIFSYHDWQGVGGQCYWLPVHRSQRCCKAQVSPTTKDHLATNANSAKLRDPELEEFSYLISFEERTNSHVVHLKGKGALFACLLGFEPIQLSEPVSQPHLCFHWSASALLSLLIGRIF